MDAKRDPSVVRSVAASSTNRRSDIHYLQSPHWWYVIHKRSHQQEAGTDRITGSCPADPALGRAVTIDFTAGASDSFTPQGNPTYDSNGASFTVAKSGDSPLLSSKWYIMFGHVEFKVKPAPGVGVVSSAVLQSDALDEIDWEWLGGDNSQVQSNYFGKGQTTTYNRGAFHPDPNNQADFHTYTIDWTADQIAWQIDGKTVRTLSPDAAQGQYPQTPMMIKVGAWSGGDPVNAPGTIGKLSFCPQPRWIANMITAWAGGSTDYASGPYSMVVKSIAVTDYSTGTQYSYSGTSGTWQSIQSQGGKISGTGSKAVGPVEAGSSSSASSESAPLPFSGTHKEAAVTTHANVYPWVASTLATSTTAPTSYPNLPSGYKVGANGRIYHSAAPKLLCWCHPSFFRMQSNEWLICDARRLPSPSCLLPRRRGSLGLRQRMMASRQ